MPNRQENIEKAVKVLKNKGIIIYPTDTAFGIGCVLSAKETVQKLFKLRRRSDTKAVPVLVGSPEMAKRYVGEIDNEVKERLIDRYWPGALTIVLKCNKEEVPILVRGGGETVGVRVPDNEVILEIIHQVGEGVVGCSANFAGEPTPYLFDSLDPQLVKLVDLVVPGKTKDNKITSTVIDCTVKPWRILRQGGILIQ